VRRGGSKKKTSRVLHVCAVARRPTLVSQRHAVRLMDDGSRVTPIKAKAAAQSVRISAASAAAAGGGRKGGGKDVEAAARTKQ